MAQIAINKINDDACLYLSQANWPKIKEVFLGLTINIQKRIKYHLKDAYI